MSRDISSSKANIPFFFLAYLKNTRENVYIRSILEQSYVVWHGSLTKETELDLERVLKAAIRLIPGKKI